MNDVQEKLLDLVFEMSEICREHDIPVVLCGGNALGLERNGGFLPWDDDIDLFITRKGFEQLDKILSAELAPERAWVTEERYPEYRNPLPRYVDTSTTLLSRSRLYDGTPLGEMVEFFVLDPFPNDPAEQLKYQKYLWLYCELLAPRFVVGRMAMPGGVVDEELYRRYETRVKSEGLYPVLEEIEREHLTYDEDECDYLCARWGVQASIVKKSWMENIEYRSFEGKMLPFFKDNTEYLDFTEYGFEWTRVPRESRVVTHNTIINLNTAFSDSIEALREQGREAGFEEALVANKRDNLELLFRRNDAQRESSVQLQAYLQTLANEWGKQSWAFDPDQFEELAYKFEPFMKSALQSGFVRWGFKVKLNDDLAETMFKVLLTNNSIMRCRNFIKVAEGWSKSSWYESAIERISAMKVCRCAHDVDGAANCVKELEEQFGLGGQIEVERTEAWLATLGEEAMSSDAIEAFEQSLLHRDDREIVKYLGDLRFKLGDVLAASKLYDQAKSTTNGVVRLELCNRGFYC